MRDLPAFVSDPLDRADAVRGDEAQLAALRGRADTRLALFWRLKPLVAGPDDALVPVYEAGDRLAPEGRQELFLGLDAAGGAVFAATQDPSTEPAPHPDPSARFMELREAAAHLDAGEASILATARSLLAWHAANGFCATCGQPTASAHGGWTRACPACAAEHFPRVSPVVIMLIVRGDRALLGRAPAWPENFYSCLAGFIEPGETPADAARREAREESGVILGAVEHLMDQPWPFPSQLMLGMKAEALTDEITVDPRELADARWFSRAEVEAMMAGTHPTVRRPSDVAVAHHLLKWWLANG